jgi:replicative DNA helicase
MANNDIQHNTKQKPLRVPPQSLDSEKAVLGSIMLRPGAIHEITDLINHTSFYAGKHREIFKIMLELSSKGDPIDLLSLSQKLSERGMLDSVGGTTYLTDLVSSVPASTNIRHYADIVEKKNILRNIIEAGGDISELGFHEDIDDVYDVLDQAEKRMMGIANLSPN